MFAPTGLPWLPDPPEDFKARCAAALTVADSGTALMRLAGHRLTSTQYLTFARTMTRAHELGARLGPLEPIRIAVLPSSTFDAIATAIPAAVVRRGMAATIEVAEYDQIVQAAFDPTAAIWRSTPDAVLVQFDHVWLGLDRFVGPEEADPVAGALDRVAMVFDAIRQRSDAHLIFTNVASPPNPLFGNLDGAVAGTVRSQIARFNAGLAAVIGSGVAIMDVAALAEQVGTSRWFDPVMWSLYKAACAPDCVPLYAEAIARVVAAMRGKSRKCLVLDCDNTLWGGVIGDDGIENIRIGEGSAEGECFLAVQKLALDLKRRGVILAISSKNFDATARAAFRDHPDMLLRESDIAIFQANWSDKASNLEAIARELNIGVESLVLLDDNGAERAQVRAALPMVGVPELPADPAYYPAYLANAGYFEATAYSAEDGQRAGSYSDNARRAEVMEKSRDLGEYLRALDMSFSAAPFDALGRSRIAQLINKSNQFNLTTRRYTEAQVAQFEGDPACVTLQVRLKDKFSDFGMIGVVIGIPHHSDPEGLELDTWLMSCRVLGRKVEHGMLQALTTAARRARVKTLYAYYLPTAKNAMVSELYDMLGFHRTSDLAADGRHYRLSIDDVTFGELPFSCDGESV
ncbi:MAG: haloacid dehalogenase [Bradyrhizobium sp.]|nr:haloacid dehalogenase [Bradyrhizobium sp.]